MRTEPKRALFEVKSVFEGWVLDAGDFEVVPSRDEDFVVMLQEVAAVKGNKSVHNACKV